MTRALVLAAVVSALAVPAFAQKPAANPDAAEYRAYRLSLPVLQKAAAATKAYIAAMNSDPRYRELIAASDEYDRLSNKDERTPAEEARMAALKKKLAADPLQALSSGDNEESLSQLEAEVRKVPPMMNAITANGLTPREYMKCLGVVMQAYIVAAMTPAVAQAVAQAAKSGEPGAQLGGAFASGLGALFSQNVAPENIAFVKANQGAVDRFMQTLKAAGPQQ
jgi:hypothetical protein